MEATAEVAVSSERAGRATAKRAWIGRVLSGVAVLFLAVDAIAKVLELKPVVEGTRQIGYPESSVFGIGVTLLACVVVHLVPRTAVFGAVLITGYLGGAIASNVRLGMPLFSHVLAPVYVALFVWGGLYLRDPRLRAAFGPVPRRRAGPWTVPNDAAARLRKGRTWT